MKIRFFALLLVILIMAGFSACGTNVTDGEENLPDSEQESANEETTILPDDGETTVPEDHDTDDAETTVSEDDDNDYRPDKVAVIGYLNELISGYFASPYSYIPDTMRYDSESRIVEVGDIPSDYSNFEYINSIPAMGMGEQWRMISENLVQSQIFYTVLASVDSVMTTSVVVFNNYIDENPEATAHHSFKEGVYTVTIKCDPDTVYYVLEYETELPVLGKQTVQIALSMDVNTKTKTVRIQIGDANALVYTVKDNYYSFAIKYLGVRRAAFEIARKYDGTVSGSIYEFISVGEGENVVDVASAAEFYITDEYVTAIGNKADGLVGFDGYICELYDVESGEMIAYEVKETLSAIEYNTIWLNLRDVSGISSVKYVPKTSDNDAMLFVNGMSDPWETKTVGFSGGVKFASRRFDIEFRKQYFYYYDAEEETYVSVGMDVPMLFVQEEVYDSLVNDVKEINGIDIKVTVSDYDLGKLLKNYDELVPIFIANKERIDSADIVEIIGERIRFN